MSPLGAPWAGFTREENNIGTTGSPMGTTITASATPNTKGSWTQLIASTAFEYLLVEVIVRASQTAATDSSTLVDIGIGAASSESVLIPDLLCGYKAASAWFGQYAFPLRVPAGSRLSARAAGATASQSVDVMLRCHGGPTLDGVFPAGGRVTAYGITAATSTGTNVTCGNNSYGSWAQLAASTAQRLRFLQYGFQGGASTTMVGAKTLFQFGIGAASSESVVVDDLIGAGDASESAAPFGFAFPYKLLDVPAGTRLACRGMLNSASANVFDVAAYGVD